MPLSSIPVLTCLSVRRAFLGGLMLWSAGLAAAVETVEATAGRKIQAPVAVRRVAPEFPPTLKKELMRGSVLLECVVDTEGKAQDIKVVEASHPDFGQAAVEALEQWEFTPGTIDGRPARIRTRLPVEFQLSTEQIMESVAGRPVFMEVRETVIPAVQLPSWPRPKTYFIPRYPSELEGSGKFGKAVVNITIDREGKVINPRIVKATYPEFIVPALVTALKLEFPPQVTANREVIHVNLDIQFDFKAPERQKAKGERAAEALKDEQKAKSEKK